MNTVEILKGAKELLVTKGWTQRTFARNDKGIPVHIGMKHTATCFCGVGALLHTAEAVDTLYYPAWAALDRAAGEHFPNFNDAEGRTLDEVLAVFDKAIAAEESSATDKE